VQLPSSIGRNVTEAVIWRNRAWISVWISASVFSAAGVAGSAASSGAAFSCSWADAFFFDLLSSLKTLTCGYQCVRSVDEAGVRTSNCHLSRCSPVSLLVTTITSFEIFDFWIHLLSWLIQRDHHVQAILLDTRMKLAAIRLELLD
jgi:hypothetical protein